MQTAIVVFLGPSLKKCEAQTILPNAAYFPPARCGDTLKILRLKPKIIVIIDGFFENTAAVWHKEILTALEQGVHVYGASSMGALRAAELAEFGMVGMGRIFEDYVQGKITDDDEVCVLHRPERSHFTPLSDALVNIRVTLNAAYQQKLINASEAELLLNLARGLHYKQRTLDGIITLAVATGCSKERMQRLERWWQEGGYINQKGLDACLVLQYVSSINLETLKPFYNKELYVHRSLFLRRIHLLANCSSFFKYEEYLPLNEKIAMHARFLGTEYRMNRELAHLLASADAIINLSSTIDDGLSHHVFSYSELAAFFPDIFIADPLFYQRMRKIDYFLTQQVHADLEKIDLYEEHLKLYFALDSSQLQNARIMQALHCISRLLTLVHWYVHQQKILINREKTNAFLAQLLKNKPALLQKLIAHCLDVFYTLDELQLHQIVTSFVLLEDCGSGNRLYVDNKIWWLWDAMRLTGTAYAAEELMACPDKTKQALEQLYQEASMPIDEYLYQLDFIDGEAGLSIPFS